MKKMVYCILIVIFMVSCNNELLIDRDINVESMIKNDNSFVLKEVFAKSLVKALDGNREVGAVIKKEALKKIDYDYDALFLRLKGYKLSNGKTFEEEMLKYLSKDTLDLIIQKYPTLTVFVPRLPEDTFSAELWNTENDVPVVAITSNKTNDVFAYDKDGNEFVIESDLIPGYPILVIKGNERVGKVDQLTKAIENNIVDLNGENNVMLYFYDDVFNNQNEYAENQINVVSKSYDPEHTTVPEYMKKWYEAYKIFNNNNGWQRDYIYYGLTHEIDRGPFDLAYKEHLVSFQMQGEPRGALNKIADQADPYPDGKWHEHWYVGSPSTGGRLTHTGWPDGEFEFKVQVSYGTKNPTGSYLVTYFRASPDQLFNLIPEKTYREDKTHFTIKAIQLKKWSFLFHFLNGI